MRTQVYLTLLCLVAAALLAFLHGRHEWRRIDVSPDSQMYHFLAVNLLVGNGYYDGPVEPMSNYSENVFQRFPSSSTVDRSANVVSRGPIYPAFLWLIYRMHGIDPDAVVRYQITLTAGIGACMVLAGWLLWGRFGAVAGLLGTFLLGTNREAAYPVSELLTECLASFLLIACLVAAAWAKQGKALRESLVAVCMSAAILTRPALLFVAVAYGGFLVLQCWRTSLVRIIAYTMPCSIILGAWMAFASVHSGTLVLLVSNGVDNLAGGLDPHGAALAMNMKPPDMSDAELESFWAMNPGGLPKSFISQTLTGALPRWRELVGLNAAKLRIATNRIPKATWMSMLLGSALVASISFNASVSNKSTIGQVTTHFLPVGVFRKRRYLVYLYLSVICLFAIVLLGFTDTWIQACFVLLPLIAPLFRVQTFGDGGNTNARHNCNYWLTSWYLGFCCMLLFGIGVSRFMRPYLPIFYLFAVMAFPALVSLMLGLFDADIGISHRRSFRFSDKSTALP